MGQSGKSQINKEQIGKEQNANTVSSCLLIDKLSTVIKDNRVLILGYGKEGQSTYRALSGIGGYRCLDIADSNPTVIDIAPDDAAFIGGNYPDALDNYDVVFKSPGIVLPDKILKKSCRIVSQTDIFISVYSRQTVGITGTKGKSTVTTLLHHTFKTNGLDTILAGNIGIPMFDVAVRIKPESIIVAELSCHQLEYCEHSPSTAVLLNLYEDHLDHYGTFERYIQAKKNIFRFQNEQDTLFTQNDYLFATSAAKSKIRLVSTTNLPFNKLEDIDNIKLRGEHNLLNAAFVNDICNEMGLDSIAFVKALRSYNPLPHRLEFIGNKNGVDYYDDSISTTVQSSISAVQSISNAGTLILGGMDRGIDYSALVDFLLNSNLNIVICMYESGKRIYEMFSARCLRPSDEQSDNNLEQLKHFVYVDDLKKAVEYAKKHTLPGTACILSPAAASYGDFTNFEERGDVYKNILFG